MKWELASTANGEKKGEVPVITKKLVGVFRLARRSVQQNVP